MGRITQSDSSFILNPMELTTLRANTLFALITCWLLTISGMLYAAAGTTVPISAELSTSIAGECSSRVLGRRMAARVRRAWPGRCE